MTWKDYEADLDKRLENLHRRVHRERIMRNLQESYVPKADGRQRPLGIAALEDKIVQQAVGTVLDRSTKRTFWFLVRFAGRSSTLRWMRYGSGL